MSSQAPLSSSYRPEIDGVRALAIGAVILNHIHKPLLPSGFLGVDVFFVISGFVITASLLRRRDRHQSLRGFLLDFYGRRIRRLLPALCLCVLLTGLALTLFNPTPGRILDTGLWSLVGLSNISLYNQSTDYFGLAADLNVFTHTWSLGVEEQFYLLFPWLFWLTGCGRAGRAGILRFGCCIGALSLASLVAFVVLRTSDPAAAFFLLPARFWELGSGALLLLGRNHPLLRPIQERLPPALPALLLLALLPMPLGLISWTTPASVVLTGALLLSLRPSTACHRLFTQPWVLAIGLMSYSLYLWHWSVLSLSRWSLGIHPWTVPLQLLLIGALAWLSFRWLETPLRRRSWSKSGWGTIAIGFGAVLATATPLALLAGPLAGLPYAGDRQQARNASFDRATRVQGTSISQDRCRKLSRSTEADCRVPARPGRPTLVLIGDSHAQHLFPTIGRLRQRLGIGVSAFAPGGYSFPALLKRGRDDPRQRQVEAFFEQSAPSLRQGDLLVLSSHLRMGFQLDDPAGGATGPGATGSGATQPETTDREAAERFETTLQRWADDAAALARRLERQGVTVLVVLPPPAFRPAPDAYPSEACLPTWFRPWPPSGCARHQRQARQPLEQGSNTVKRILRGSLDAVPNVWLFDPFDHFCPPGTDPCRAVLNGVPTFRDDNHLSFDGALGLADPLEAFLEARGWPGAAALHGGQ